MPWGWVAIGIACGCLAAAPGAAAEQSFEFGPAAAGDAEALARSMSKLASEVIAVYREGDRGRYLDNLFRLQLVAGRDAAAAASLAALRAVRSAGDTPAARAAGAANVQYEILAGARIRERAAGESFGDAFARTFRATLGALDDHTAALVLRAVTIDQAPLRRSLADLLRSLKGRHAVSIGEALSLVKAFQVERDFRAFMPRATPLVAEDDRRRYLVDADVQVRTPDGATVCVLAMRPRAVPGRLPALLNFTIYTDKLVSEARRTASNGYAAVEGLTRGKGCSPDPPVPYEHDGDDASAVIDWISRQPWSDGRVGMYGGSYEGFTQWAAAKHMPKALKALMPSVAAAPGIDVPMEGNVFQSFVYYWPLYAASGKTLDAAAIDDRARWLRMQRQWYVGGRPYRELDRIDGTPNPFFDRWLDHPAYDSYWQRMIPYGQDFARIDIPILTTTGYYDGGQIGALYYFIEHHRARPGAEHYLLIGPYDHVRGQRGTISPLGEELTALNGYETDPAAQIDLGELRYQWFEGVPSPPCCRTG